MLRIWNVVMLGALLPLIVATRGDETTVRGDRVEALDYVVHLIADPCEYHCRPCPDDEHDIVVAVYKTHKSSHLEVCNPGDCSSHECEGGVESIGLAAAFVTAVKAAGPEQLRAFLGRYREQAYYNSERGAIQIIGCNDQLWASIPVRPEIAEVLAD